jgi:hypothetical protein
MTTISNIFSNIDDSKNNKSIINGPSEYNKSNNDTITITQSLSQGKKFEKYQKKITHNLEKKVRFEEVFKEAKTTLTDLLENIEEEENG